jgi:hypothetical protein
MAYKIVRNYFKGGHRVIDTGLTLKEAQEHCSNPETSSRTCKSAKAKAVTRRMGQWFDGYDEIIPKKRRGTFAKKSCKRRK